MRSLSGALNVKVRSQFCLVDRAAHFAGLLFQRGEGGRGRGLKKKIMTLVKTVRKTLFKTCSRGDKWSPTLKRRHGDL